MRWREFVVAFEAGDDERCLLALRAWIEEWDRAFWAGDFSDFPLIYEQDFRAENRTRFFDIASVDGVEDFKRLRSQMRDVLARFRFEVLEFERRGSSFAGLGVVRARGRYTGLLLRVPNGVVWRVRDGKLVHADAFSSRRKARSFLREGAAARS